MNKLAVVLLSGGLDSATVLAMARRDGYVCHALTLDYGQRHRVEITAARRVAALLGAASHRVATFDMSWIGGSALTDVAIAVPEQSTAGIPVTYVPARNTIMLSLALAWAEVLEASSIFVGANAVDYSGYPDCRPEYLEAFQHLAGLATKAGVEGRGVQIRAPIVNLTKAAIIHEGTALGLDYGQTVSCYQPDAAGRACGRCAACRIRADGFRAAQVADPTHYQ